MEGVFLRILSMSISACPVFAAVLLVRLLLKKAPKWLLCALWLLPAMRLCCPVFPEAWFSLLPRQNATALPFLRAAESGAVTGLAAPAASAAASPSPFPLFAVIWLAGVCLMLAYALVSWLRLKRRVAAYLSPEPGVRVCDEAESPFILGILHPVICLPSSLRSPDLEQVLAHERAHLRRRDHRWKPLGWLILSLHWFNPLCWLAYILFCRDTEAACDEKVIRDLDRAGQAAYAQALLNCGAPRRLPAACPLAFGETGVKGRVKGILSYRKPAFWLLLAAVVLCVVLVLCFLTDPVRILPEDAEVKSAFYCNLKQTPDNTIEYISLAPEQAEELRSLLLRSGKRRYFGHTPLPVGTESDGLSCCVDLNLTDGTFCQVLYVYYSGFDFLRGREDDYYTRVYVLGRRTAYSWLMSEDFDKAFSDWRFRLLAGLREAEAQDPQ